MKKILVIALLLASTAAYADNSAPAPSTPPGQSAGGPGGAQQGQRLEQIKQRIVAKLQEKQSCVEAAQTREALRACMPRRGEGHGEGGGGRFGHGGGFGGGNAGGNGGGAPAPAPAQ